MAYFLDPELAALVTGGRRTATATVDAPQTDRRKNKFGKSCHKCTTWVAAEKGYLGKEKGAWVVYCTKCP